MNESDTADVVKRIVGTWPMSPKGFLWTEAIGEFDYAPALAAFTQLRNTVEESRISIARFIIAYRAIANAGNTSRGEPADTCPLCDGTGMRSGHQRIGTVDYSVVVACDCPAGHRADKTLRRVDEYNARHSGPERRTDVGPVVLGGST